MRRRVKVGVRVWIGIAVLAGAVVLTAPSAFGTGASSEQTTPAKIPGNMYQGYLVFNDYFCAACHRLKQAGSFGPLGVNLNKKPVPYATARAVVISGLPAALPLYPTQMVGYENVLNKRQIRNVAGFVAKYAGKPKLACEDCTPPETTTTQP